MQQDTICALATKTGGAIAIIRISGEQSLAVLSRIFTHNLVETPANTIVHGFIMNHEEVVDEVLVSVFRAPHSYTGEDSAEVSCHGSAYVVDQIIQLLVANGCRMAHPGEYTQRAYLNGKLDLSQAEAVADLIAANNKATHRLAVSQLRGGISNELSVLRDQLLHLTSMLELELDFSDHEDLEFADRTELLEVARQLDGHIRRLAASFQMGQAIKQGIPVAIVGKTNVGKSTLLNRLLKEERAIVSDIHGTTRDTIEDVMDIRGVQFRFIDTAGFRPTDDTVEQIGIERTYQSIDKARIVLWLIDATPTQEELEGMMQRTSDKALIIVCNKSDQQTPTLPERAHSYPHIAVSAKFGTHIEKLETLIYDAAQIPDIKESEVIVTNARHYEALLRARSDLEGVISGLKSHLSGDLVAESLRLVLSDLSEITGQGQITPSEVLHHIFSHFCIGK